MSTRIEREAAFERLCAASKGRAAGDPLTQRERTPVRVYPHSAQANKAVAGLIADLIRQRAAEGRNCVLGLATGSTPVEIGRASCRERV